MLEGKPQRSLPSFERPPVVEVVLGVQFAATQFLATHLGLLWSRFRHSFPRVEQHAPVPVATDLVGESSAGIRIEFAEPLTPRCWFVAEDRTHLLQIQPGLFSHNWRKTKSNPSYPRYPLLRSEFRSELETLSSFLEAERIGPLRIHRCEVTYVNHILADGGAIWSGHGDISKVTRVFAPNDDRDFLPATSSSGFRLDYQMEAPTAATKGGLVVTMTPGFETASENPMFNLTLSAQGTSKGNDIGGAMNFLDEAHEWVVRGFADLITDGLHRHWGRTDHADS